jgi:patatin-like phospholipase/acyl hydrolase
MESKPEERERAHFRILSLDGGGIKGAFTAAVLAALEKQTGCRVVDHFDLIAGTSTGGILAIGLGLGFPAEDLLQFYIDRGPEIFPSTGPKSRLGWLRQIFQPKHSHLILRKAIEDVLGDALFGDSKCRLVIPTYDAVGGRIFIMKTPHHSRFVHDAPAAAVDVALATSAAPTYFQAAHFPVHSGASYVDGGVWANCPAMVAVTEAISFLGQRAGGIDILSIGTTSSPFNIAKQRDAGAARWNIGIMELMFEAQVEAARAQAALIAGRLHRIDAAVMRGQFALDRADRQTIEDLVTLGRGEAVKKANLEAVESRFLNGTKAAPFQPVSWTRPAGAAPAAAAPGP